MYSTTKLSVPTHMVELGREVVLSVSCGSGHTLARTQSGNAYAWGDNSNGQLGLGDLDHRDNPQIVTKLRKSKLYLKTVVFLSAGDRNSAFISQEHEVFIGGSNANNMCASKNTEKKFVYPLPITKFEHMRIKAVEFGGEHAAAVSVDGDVYTWGRGDHGQLGHGEAKSETEPRLMTQHLNYWSVVKCGALHSAAIGYDGNVYTWGANNLGQCARLPLSDLSLPKAVMTLSRTNVTALSCGANSTVVLTDENDLMSTRVISDAKDPAEKKSVRFHRLMPRYAVQDFATSLSSNAITAFTLAGAVLTWNAESNIADQAQPLATESELEENVCPQSIRMGNGFVVMLASLPEDGEKRFHLDSPHGFKMKKLNEITGGGERYLQDPNAKNLAIRHTSVVYKHEFGASSLPSSPTAASPTAAQSFKMIELPGAALPQMRPAFVVPSLPTPLGDSLASVAE